MKNFLFGVIICLLTSANVNAARITAITNGNWSSTTTWDAGRPPLDNDQVVIPASIVVAFTGSPYPKNTPSTRPTLNIKIYGTLDFSALGNDKLYLDVGSTIEIFTNGKIETNTSSSEIIAIYTGSTDNTVWSGTPAILNGPLNATATTSGFANGILPVMFESFTVKKDNKGFATLSWITSAEQNSSHFEIERSLSGSASWQTAGIVDAAGYSSAAHQYYFTVQLVSGENLFRLKEVDIDGKYTYSIIVSINYSATENISVSYNQSTHQLSFQGVQNDQLKIHIFDTAGHLIVEASAASAPVIFQPPVSGVYFVNVVSRGARFAEKIIVH